MRMRMKMKKNILQAGLSILACFSFMLKGMLRSVRGASANYWFTVITTLCARPLFCAETARPLLRSDERPLRQKDWGAHTGGEGKQKHAASIVLCTKIVLYVCVKSIEVKHKQKLQNIDLSRGRSVLRQLHVSITFCGLMLHATPP